MMVRFETNVLTWAVGSSVVVETYCCSVWSDMRNNSYTTAVVITATTATMVHSSIIVMFCWRGVSERVGENPLVGVKECCCSCCIIHWNVLPTPRLTRHKIYSTKCLSKLTVFILMWDVVSRIDGTKVKGVQEYECVYRVILHRLLCTTYYELRSSAQYDYKQDLIVWYALDGTTEALRYKPGRRGFDSRLGHWDFVFA